MKKQTNRKLIIAIVMVAVFLAVFAAIRFFQSIGGRRGADQYLERGNQYLAAMEYEEAVIAFTNAIRVDDKAVDAYLGRAEAYAAQNDYQGARADYVKAIELDPSREMEIRSLMDSRGIPRFQPLTAEDVKWLVEPTYTFGDIEPIGSSDFYNWAYDDQIGFANGKPEDIKGVWSVELNFPTYSYLDEYYSITDGNKKMLFYMPDRVQSNTHSIESGEHFYIDTNYGIGGVHYDSEEDFSTQRYEEPWNAMEIFTAYRDTDSGSAVELICNIQTQAVYFYRIGMGEYGLIPADQSILHKTYAVAGIDFGNRTFDNNGFETREMDGDAIYSIIGKSLTTSPHYALWDGSTDKILTEFIYDEIGTTSDGITAAKKNGKWGYLDAAGAEITDFIYDAPWNDKQTWVEKWSDEYQMVTDGQKMQSYIAYPCTCDTMVVSKEGQMGLLYRDGRLLLAYGQFEDLAPAWNNQLWAKQDGLWGLIDLADAKAKSGFPEWDISKAYDVDKASAIPKRIMLDGLEIQPDDYYGLQYYGYTVTAQPTLSMRTGPGTEYERIASIPYGSEIGICSPEKNGWVVVYYGRFGWVSKEYLR